MQNSVGQQNLQTNQCQTQYQTQPAMQPIQQAASTAPAQQTIPVPQQCPPQQYQQQSYPVSQGQNVQVPNYSGVNIQIFNPSVTPPGATAPVYNVNAPNYASNGGCYPSGYYTNNWGQGGQQNQNDTTNITNKTETINKKTEKRQIVQLTDDYIRNLENYLNSQDKEVRLMGAKEVVARLEEDKSRKDDKALNALVNKMLQDPSTPVKFLALGALDSRAASGDDYTVMLLKNMQNSQSGYGQDALQATNILLKMSGQTVEKEFEVKDTKKIETKSNGEK